MWLITGGAYQGKLAYALNVLKLNREDVVDGADCTWEDILRAPIINHFHLWIRRMLEEKKDMGSLVFELIEKNPEVIIIVNELGCGIVPIDPFDREYREVTGRICQTIAKEAKEVHRVVCQIGQVIKHD